MFIVRIVFQKSYILLCTAVILISSLLCGCVAPSAYFEDNPPQQVTTIPTQTSTTSTAAAVTTITSATTTTTTTTTTTSITTTTSTQRTKRTTGTTVPTTAQPILKGHKIEGVPVIHQMPNYPTGCETISAIMTLKYWNEKITIDGFIDQYLLKSTYFHSENGVYYGPDPYECFVGDPRSTNSYGCMAPVIEKALINYFGSDDRVINATGKSLEELCATYIDNDIPVLTWVTIGMLDTYPGDKWYLDDGTLFRWPANEHCMVLIGYDSDYYYFNDPYRGTVKKYAKWLAEKQYKALGRQFLIITG